MLPEPGSAVVLRDPDGGEHLSSIISHHVSTVLIGAPTNLPDAPSGTRLLVTWEADNLQWCAPAVIHSKDSDGATWELVMSEDPWQEERRRYPRRIYNATIDLGYEVDGLEYHADAKMIELSEAALRCAVREEHNALTVGTTPLSIVIIIEGDVFELTGYVLTGRPSLKENDRLEVVVLFERPVPGVERLRKHLG